MAAVFAIACVGLLGTARVEAADWRVVQPPGGQVQDLAVADAATWLAEVPSVCCTRLFELTEDGGVSWDPIQVAGFTYADLVGPVADGSFRVIARRKFGAEDQELQVFRIVAGAAEPVGPVIVGKTPLYDSAAVSDDGVTWVPHWNPDASVFELAIVGTDGSVDSVELPDSATTYGWEARSTVLGMRLLRHASDPVLSFGYERGTYRLKEDGSVVLAEPYPVYFVDGEVISSDFGKTSWDGGQHWSQSPISGVSRSPGLGSPRYLGSRIGVVAERFSPYLYRPSGLSRPTEFLSGLVDAGTSLIAWSGDGIWVHEGTLPPMPTAIGTLEPDTQRMLARANLIRADAGLPPLTGDALVSLAARNHSTYTTLNTIDPEGDAHSEQPGLPGFTGNGPWDRCEAVGTSCNSEVMYGTGVVDPVGGWLATIYHRPLLGGPEAGVVGAAEVTGGWAVADSKEPVNTLIRPFGYPNGRWRGEEGFSGEIPDPIKACQSMGQPIEYPVGVAVTLYMPVEYEGRVSRIELRKRGNPVPLPGCLLTDYVGSGKEAGVFIPDDPLVPGQAYDVKALWNPGPEVLANEALVPGPDLTHEWSFYFDSDVARARPERLCRGLVASRIRSVARSGRAKRPGQVLGLEEKVRLKQKGVVWLGTARFAYWSKGIRHPVRLKLAKLRGKRVRVGKTVILRLPLPPKVAAEMEPGEKAELRLEFGGRLLRGCTRAIHVHRVRKVDVGWIRARGPAWVAGRRGRR